MTYQTIAKKFRRALRNGTGATFTLDQLRQLAEAGVLKHLAELESDELCASNSNTADAGSTSDETVKPQGSTRSLDATEAQSFIAALGRKTTSRPRAS